MVILYSFLFIIIIIGSLGILYVYQYNKLQHSKTKIEHAECLIDEELRSRFDILIKIDSLINTELETKSLFKDLDKLKKDTISNFDLDRKLVSYYNILEQIRIDHDKLNQNKAFKSLINEANKSYEKLQAAKSYYNKYTSELNELIRAFPSNIIAKLHNFSIKSFFDGKNMQDDIVDDFKL